jgi:hypothetical protein
MRIREESEGTKGARTSAEGMHPEVMQLETPLHY